MIDTQDKKMDEINNNLKELLGTDDISDEEMELLIYVDSDNEEEKLKQNLQGTKSIDEDIFRKISSISRSASASSSPLPSTSKVLVKDEELKETTSNKEVAPVDLVVTPITTEIEPPTPCETSLNDVNIEKILDKNEGEKNKSCSKKLKTYENSKKSKEIPKIPETHVLDQGTEMKNIEDLNEISNIEKNDSESVKEMLLSNTSSDVASSEVRSSSKKSNQKPGNSLLNIEKINDVIIIDDGENVDPENDLVACNKDKPVELIDVIEVIEAVVKPLVNDEIIINEPIPEISNNPLVDDVNMTKCEESNPTNNTKSDAESDVTSVLKELKDTNSIDEDTKPSTDNDVVDSDQNRCNINSKETNEVDDQVESTVKINVSDQGSESIDCAEVKVNDEVTEKPDDTVDIKENDSISLNVPKDADKGENVIEVNAHSGDIEKEKLKIDKIEEVVDEGKMVPGEPTSPKTGLNLEKMLSDDIIDIDEILDSVIEIDKKILIQHEIIDGNHKKDYPETDISLIDNNDQTVAITDSKDITPETALSKNIDKPDCAVDDVVIIDITETKTEESSENGQQPKIKRPCNVDLRETNINDKDGNSGGDLVSDSNSKDVVLADADVNHDDIVKKNVNKRRLSCIESHGNSGNNNEILKKTKINDENENDDVILIKNNDNEMKSMKFKNIIKKLATQLNNEITITEEPIKLDPKPKTVVTEPSKLSVEFLRAFNKPLKNMTRKDLEQLVQQKIIEILLCNSELAEVRRKVIEQEQLLHIFRLRCNELQKQFCDLEMIHTRIVKDLETRNKNYVAPVKITRTVCVQVNQSSFEGPSNEESEPLINKDENKSSTTSLYRSQLQQHQLQAMTKISPTFLDQQKSHKTSGDTKTITPQPLSNKKFEVKLISTQRHSLPAVGITTRSSSESLRNSKTKQPSPPSVNVTTISLPPLAKISDEVSSRQRVPPIIIKKTQGPAVSENKSTKTSAGGATKQTTNDLKRSFIDLTEEEEVVTVNRPTFSIVNQTQNVMMTGQQPQQQVQLQNPQQMQKLCAVINGQPQTLVTFSNSNNKEKIAYLINNTTSTTRTANGATTTLAGSNNLATLQNLNGKKFVNIAPKPIPSPSAPKTYSNGTTHSSKENSTEKIRLSVKSMSALGNCHPALLPTPHFTANTASGKKVPPRPEINITLENQGVVIKWTMDEWSESEHAPIARYQLYAYQEKGPPSPDLWRRVGEVKSMKLPMAVTLTQFEDGQMYYFAIRAIDIYERSGWFSVPRPYL